MALYNKLPDSTSYNKTYRNIQKEKKPMTETSWVVTLKHSTFKTTTHIFTDLKQAFEFIVFASEHCDIKRITLKKWSVKL